MNFKYRPEIDGLRGLSVIAVIFYHSGLEIFKAGYLGVDIFFVISGYLITNIILVELNDKCFNLLNFFQRRIRRIIPLLFFVCLVVTPFVWYIFSFVLLESYGETLVSIGLFSSNILFFLTADYFNLVSELKPLIHTWSLSVEEQFYLFFPFFLISIYKYNIKIIYILVIFIILLSFFLGLNENYFSMDTNFASLQDKSFTSFYLLPGRIWQLFLGALVAIYLNKNKLKNSNLLSLIGLFLIIFFLFINNNFSNHYVLNSLAPSIGTFLILLFTGNKNFVKEMLSLKILIYIGIISYSLYLWHQPVFSLVRVYAEDINLSKYQLLCCLIIITFLSVLSWKYIEKPFRNREIIKGRKLFIILILMFSIIMMIGFYLHFSKGSYKLDKLSKNYSTIEFDKKKDVSNRINYLENYNKNFDISDDKIKILILGDSHSQDLFIALNQNKNLIKKYSFSNVVINNIFNIDTNSNKFKYSDAIIMTYSSSHMNDILLRDSDFFTKLDDFKRKKNKNIWLTTSSPYFSYFGEDVLLQIINKWHLSNTEKITQEIINKKTYSLISRKDYNLNKWLEKKFIEHNLPYLDKMDYICPNFNNNSCYGVTDKFEKIYFDGSHTTLKGAKFFSEIIFGIGWLDKMFTNK
jgi:peptidoglycan/LPS O-acetylase OafA/YrhL